MRRHDRINTRDLVDRAVPYVVGAWLFNKDREPLYQLAESRQMAQRSTALTSTLYFIKHGDSSDSLKLAALLLQDHDELIQKAIGWVFRTVPPSELRMFLQTYRSEIMRKTMLEAIQNLTTEQKRLYKTAAKP